MATRKSRETVTFNNPFSLADGECRYSAGNYEIVTDEELIEGLSFPAYRRLATMIVVPAQSHYASSVEMLNIDPLDLAAALQRDELALNFGAIPTKVR